MYHCRLTDLSGKKIPRARPVPPVPRAGLHALHPALARTRAASSTHAGHGSEGDCLEH